MKTQESALSFGGVVGSSRDDRTLYWFGKRLLDLTIVVGALLLLLPLILLIAILVKLDSPGPIFFVQERVGARRRQQGSRRVWETCTFPMIKFRTMYVDAGSSLHREYIEAYIRGDEQKMQAFNDKQNNPDSYKLTADPRVTPIGNFLRKTSLDELPQLWNIIRGEMSLVGPRPPIPYEVAMYPPESRQRLAAIPGLTGWWQVRGRCVTSFEEMVRLDVEYIENQSLWLDMKILLLTVPAAVSSKGAG